MPLGIGLKTTGDLRELDALAAELTRQAGRDPQFALPLFVYYFGGYYSASATDEDALIDEVTQGQLTAYKHALDGTAIASAAPFVKWFRQREDYENEMRTEDPAFRDVQLDAARGAVRELLPGFDLLRIRRQPRGAELDLRHLSAGERYLLALGGDISILDGNASSFQRWSEPFRTASSSSRHTLPKC